MAQLLGRIKYSSESFGQFRPAAKQLADRQAKNRMAPFGGNIGYRLEHETASVGLWMGQNETPPRAAWQRPSNDFASEIDDIHIKRSRAPANAGTAAGRRFQAFGKNQQFADAYLGLKN